MVPRDCAIKVLVKRSITTVMIFLLLPSRPVRSQKVTQVDTQVQQNGMSTGGAHAPVKDALSRPITAGGFVEFSDITTLRV